MSIDARRLRKGMIVRNPDGHRIGRFGGVQGEYFRVKRGRIFSDEYLARLEDVRDVTGDDIVLDMRGTLPGEANDGRNSGSRGLDVAERMHDERLL